MISEAALQEFKNLWHEEFGEDISDEKAMEIAPKLLNLFDHIYRPIKKTWLEPDSENGDVQKIKNDDEYDKSRKSQAV